MSNFISDRHSLYVGWVIGIAHRNGVPLEPVRDDAGDWTDRAELTLSPHVTITLVVPPPPDDWTLEDAVRDDRAERVAEVTAYWQGRRV